MRFSIAMATLAATLAFSGCATLDKDAFRGETAKPGPDDDKPSRTSRNLTVTWDNIGRGGAAMRQPGFIDVLANEDTFGPAQSFMPSRQQASASAIATVALAPPSVPAAALRTAPEPPPAVETTYRTSYSTYELQRWQRFCNRGIGMTDLDWQLVDSNSARVPAGAFPSCAPPAYGSQEYKQAWSAFCAGNTLSPSMRSIVKASARPSNQPAAKCKGIAQ